MPILHKGFTLIELMIVMAIIAILAVISVSAYSGVQKNARDAKRKQEVNEIHKALEQYKLATGNYPAVTDYSCSGISGGVGNCNGGISSTWTSSVGGTSYYNNGAPIDPINNYQNNTNYTYSYDGLGTICALNLEINSQQFCLPPEQ